MAWDTVDTLDTLDMAILITDMDTDSSESDLLMPSQKLRLMLRQTQLTTMLPLLTTTDTVSAMPLTLPQSHTLLPQLPQSPPSLPQLPQLPPPMLKLPLPTPMLIMLTPTVLTLDIPILTDMPTLSASVPLMLNLRLRLMPLHTTADTVSYFFSSLFCLI